MRIGDTRPAPSPALDALGPGPLLVSPYNLEPRKNLAALLEAFARLPARPPPPRLVLFGRAAITPEREQAFRQHVAALGIGERVVLTGYLHDDDLTWLYRRATVFVFPSLYEGFGLPVLEAMAVGACVVVRDASAMGEVVGEAGLRLETKDSEALARGLQMLLEDEPARARFAAAARPRAAEFTVRRMAEQTLAAYRRALGESPRWAHLRQPAP